MTDSPLKYNFYGNLVSLKVERDPEATEFFFFFFYSSWDTRVNGSQKSRHPRQSLNVFTTSLLAVCVCGQMWSVRPSHRQKPWKLSCDLGGSSSLVFLSTPAFASRRTLCFSLCSRAQQADNPYHSFVSIESISVKLGVQWDCRMTILVPRKLSLESPHVTNM